MRLKEWILHCTHMVSGILRKEKSEHCLAYLALVSQAEEKFRPMSCMLCACWWLIWSAIRIPDVHVTRPLLNAAQHYSSVGLHCKWTNGVARGVVKIRGIIIIMEGREQENWGNGQMRDPENRCLFVCIFHWENLCGRLLINLNLSSVLKNILGAILIICARMHIDKYIVDHYAFNSFWTMWKFYIFVWLHTKVIWLVFFSFFNL